MKLFWSFLLIFLVACSSKKVLEYEKSENLKQLEEYDKKLEVKELPPAEAEAPTTPPTEVKAPEQEPETDGTSKKAKKTAKKEKKKPQPKPKSTKHLPDIEDSEGFIARRPINDPFRIGEKITLNLSYFNIVAGTLDIMVKPFVQVNGEKSYHFQAHAVSNSFFSHIYAVDNWAETYMGFETMIPRNLSITLKESKQLAEKRTFFDWATLKANYWQRRVTKESGEEFTKKDWDIKEFSQNVISAVYYLRTFTFRAGKKMAIRVADEGKNIVFTGEVVRKEVLDTEIGRLKTIVIKPKIEVDGVLSPVGDIWIWLTDDDRKFMVRAETKIRIGSIMAKVKSIDPGGDGKMPEASKAPDEEE